MTKPNDPSKNTKEEYNSMAKNTNLAFEDFISDLADLVARYQGDSSDGAGPAPKAAKGKAAKKAAEPVPAEDEDEGVDEDEDEGGATADIEARRAELTRKRINTLRKEVVALGFDEEDVEDADKETLVETILEDEFGEDDDDSDDDDSDEDEADEEEAEDEDEDDEDDEEGDDEDDEVEYDRETLEGFNLKELKRVAKEEFEFTTADLKGLDQETIIGMLLGEDEEDEDEDDEEYTEEELLAMTLNELKGLAKQYGVKVKPGTKKRAIVNSILEAGE